MGAWRKAEELGAWDLISLMTRERARSEKIVVLAEMDLCPGHPVSRVTKGVFLDAK